MSVTIYKQNYNLTAGPCTVPEVVSAIGHDLRPHTYIFQAHILMADEAISSKFVPNMTRPLVEFAVIHKFGDPRH